MIVVVVVVTTTIIILLLLLLLLLLTMIAITTTIIVTIQTKTLTYRPHDVHGREPTTGEVPTLESHLPLEGARVWRHFLCGQSLTQQFGSICWTTNESDLVGNANLCKLGHNHCECHPTEKARQRNTMENSYDTSREKETQR